MAVSLVEDCIPRSENSVWAHSAQRMTISPRSMSRLSDPSMVSQLRMLPPLALHSRRSGQQVISVFYNKLTKDRLASLPLSSEAPFSSIVYNNGTLRNRGIEIALGGEVFNLNG